MIIVPHTQQATSRRSRELATALRSTIADFERANPKVTREEVAAAVSEVSATVTPEVRATQRQRVLLATVAGIVLALGMAMMASAKEHGANVNWGLAPVAVILAVVVAVIAVRARDR